MLPPSRPSRILGAWPAFLGWVATLLGGYASPASMPSPPRRPHVVLMVADDLGWGELGCYGQEKIRTPHLDRLARQGRRFTQHYSGAPVCAPSRCVLLTGLHLGHAEIRGNLQARKPDGSAAEGQHPLSARTLTLAAQLGAHGYATAAIGKWGLGSVDSTGAPHRQGFDLFFGYNCQAVAHSYYPGHLWRNTERIPLNDPPIPGHARQPEGPVLAATWTGSRYASEVMLSEALAYLRERARVPDRPFFLYLPFIEPHVALQPPASWVEAYPAEWDDQPYRGQCGYTPQPRPRAAYAALITSLDRNVGAILQTLDETGLAENTLVVFTSDNGPTHESPGDPVFGIGGVDTGFFRSTAGLRGRKGSVYEGGLRVPLIVRWPGRVPAGSTDASPSFFADHFPTLCAAAGVPIPPGLDGVNQLPLWTGHGPAPERTPLVWVFPEYGGQVAVRLGRHKVLRRNLTRKTGPDPWEVYDLDQDPGESRNLASRRPELIAEALQILRTSVNANPVFPVPIPGLARTE